MLHANFIGAIHISLLMVIQFHQNFCRLCTCLKKECQKCINFHEPQLVSAYSVISCQCCWPCPPSLDRNNCYSAGDKTISDSMQIDYILNIICFQCDGCVQGSAVNSYINATVLQARPEVTGWEMVKCPNREISLSAGSIG